MIIIKDYIKIFYQFCAYYTKVSLSYFLQINLIIIFFIFITPTGLIMRLIKKFHRLNEEDSYRIVKKLNR